MHEYLRKRFGMPMIYRDQDIGGAGGGSGSGDSGQTQNNQGQGTGGNSSGAQNDSQDGNNTGQGGFDLSKFWDQPAEDSRSNQQQQSRTQQEGNDQGQSQQGQQTANAFQQRLQAMSFGDGVMTPETFAALGRGEDEGGPDFQTFNQGMNQFGRQVVRNAVLMAAELIQAYGGQLEGKFQSLVDQKLGSSKANDALLAAIPAAKDKRFAPVINSVYQQAMKISGGDSDKAIQMTKEMLKATGQGIASDVGLELPPDESGSNTGIGKKTNWAETLMARD